MKIKWLGHSCFLITSASGFRIITDPYKIEGTLGYKPVREAADVVTISHLHFDHGYTGDMPNVPRIIQDPGKQAAGGLEFTGIATYHDKAQGRQRGLNTIFCFDVDGIRLCHCGDLGHPLDDATLKALGKVDVLFIPTGGSPPTIDLDEAIALWEKLKPAVVIPMHFRNDKCSFPKYSADDLIKKRPKTIMSGKTELEYIRDSLPENQVIIMDHAL